ncbi:hypothetical protein [Melaminivora sp.]|uniref:hypothetical protein n=1 Tax=Melaminivora sp. TaxID=1933032 RepID=UPI0028AC702A|nr:hypothetical protein [Melaminivora sp.]
MHPQNEKTTQDVSPQTGKPREEGQGTQDAEVQTSNKESAQRRDLQSNVGSDNQVQERRGTNLDKF